MSVEFFQTVMGHKFYEGDVPRIAKALERIATALEGLNPKESEERCPKCHELIEDCPVGGMGNGSPQP